MNYEGRTTWADFRHEAGWSLEERYPRKAKYERKQYSITRTEDISVYSVIFGVCSWVKVQPKGGLPPHTNTIQASCIAKHPALLHAPCSAVHDSVGAHVDERFWRRSFITSCSGLGPRDPMDARCGHVLHSHALAAPLSHTPASS